MKDASKEIGKIHVPKITEDQLQKQVASYMDLKYPKVLFCHVPNGGSRHFLEAVKFKAMGVKPGVPDLLIFAAGKRGMNPVGINPYLGLAIELKVGKNKTNENQIKFLTGLALAGWKTAVCYSFDEAREEIDNYLK